MHTYTLRNDKDICMALALVRNQIQEIFDFREALQWERQINTIQMAIAATYPLYSVTFEFDFLFDALSKVS